MTGAAVEVRRNGILNLSALGAEAAGMLVAYIQPATKTAFDAGTGQFSWLSGDEIDAVVRDKENVYSGRRYSALDAGLESRFALVEGEKADDLVLTGWAFYPSRENEAAQNGGYALQAFLTDRFTVRDIIGRTVIIHDGLDDFTSQPAGNAGARIACGVIRRTCCR